MLQQLKSFQLKKTNRNCIHTMHRACSKNVLLVLFFFFLLVSISTIICGYDIADMGRKNMHGGHIFCTVVME